MHYRYIALKRYPTLLLSLYQGKVSHGACAYLLEIKYYF